MRAPVQWIPEVAEAANCLYANLEPGTTLASQIYRLGTDRRLAVVWKTLAQARDDKNITALFWVAVACCDDILTVVTRREVEERAAQFRTTAQQLHHLVGLVQGDSQKRVFRRVAKMCEGLASTAVSDRNPSLVVERKVNLKVRAYVVYFSGMVKGMCGRPFDKLVGRIAMVALDLKKPISERTVEYWRKHRS